MVKKMTGSDLREWMDRNKINTPTLAEMICTPYKTVYHWLTARKEKKIPGIISSWIKLYELIKKN
jgi:hypothetical protein